MSFQFDRQALLELAGAHHSEYCSAQPFPHIVIDDFVPEGVLEEVLAEFPSQRDARWMRFESDNERKLASREDTPMGDATRHLLMEFNAAPFIEFLEELTGIQGLVGDTHFEGGGMHQIVRGGHLNVHVDFNRHPRTALNRRLNVLLYLNRDWKDEYGGALELWSRDMKRCEQRILPVWNRLVVFSTTEHSYHGHPEPLSCPEEQTRKSLALYYYSLDPRGAISGGSLAHNTLWRRPGGSMDLQGVSANGQRMKTMVRLLTPPLFLELARATRHRARARASRSR